MGNKTFDFASKKKDFLPKNDQIWPKTGIFDQFGPGHAGLFSALLVGSVGGCGARAVSRKTPIYFICYKGSLPIIIDNRLTLRIMFSIRSLFGQKCGNDELM